VTLTARSRKLLDAQGYTTANVEHYSTFTRRRHDLFGFVDILAIRKGETLAVQTTSASNVSARVRKIADHENVAAVRDAGWRIVVHGWRKVGNRWQVREVDCS
jgi:carbonic anhydrase